MAIRARADRSLVRAGKRSRRVVRVEVTAPEAAPGAERPRLALSLVLDRSGSMEGKKIELAREAAVSAIRSLREGDRFAVVVYDDRVDVLQAAVDVSPQSVDAAVRTVERVDARNSTDLHGGWEAGCREAFGSISVQRLARVLLLSDGLANHGLTDRGEIVRRATERRLSGVATSTFGIGADYDEGLLSAMAEAGGGNFRYVATADEIPRYVSEEMDEVLSLSLPEAEIEVRGPEGLEVECPNEFPVRRVDGALRVAIGSLVSGQRLSLLLDVRFPPASEGDALPVRLELLARGEPAGGQPVELAFTVAGHEANDRQPADEEVRRERARVEEKRSMRKALELNRDGDYRGAAAATVKAAEQLRLYAPGVPEVEAIADRLGEEAAKVSREMDPVARKVLHSVAYYSIKGRALRGMTVIKSPFRTMTTANLDLISALEEAAEAYRAAPRRSFGGYPDLFVGWPLPEPPDAGAPLTDGDEDLLAREARAYWRPDQIPVTVVFTSRPLAGAAPWHWHGDLCVAIASTAGLCAPGGVSPAAFVAYQTFLHGLRERGIAPEEMTHAEDRGCLYDPCTRREGLERSLSAATFCDECRQVLERASLFPEPALSIADVIRSLAGVTAGGVN